MLFRFPSCDNAENLRRIWFVCEKDISYNTAVSINETLLFSHFVIFTIVETYSYNDKNSLNFLWSSFWCGNLRPQQFQWMELGFNADFPIRFIELLPKLPFQVGLQKIPVISLKKLLVMCIEFDMEQKFTYVCKDFFYSCNMSKDADQILYPRLKSYRNY